MTFNPTKVIIHHSVTDQNATLTEGLESVNRIHEQNFTNEYGLNDSGTDWRHIQYHVIIAKDGSYKQTRLYDRSGWHAGNTKDGIANPNEESIAICLLGNFEVDTPSVEQVATLTRVVQYLRGQFDINVVNAHRDYGNTACCGDNLYKLIPDLQESYGFWETILRRVYTGDTIGIFDNANTLETTLSKACDMSKRSIVSMIILIAANNYRDIEALKSRIEELEK